MSREVKLEGKQRSPLLSARLDWIVLELIILFGATVVYTIITWIDIRTPTQNELETFRSVIKEVVPFSQWALICILGIFEIGGEIMLRYTFKMQQAREEALEEGLEQGLEQGREEGREEVYQAWHADWEKRKAAAEAKGIPFDEPPPPNPNGHHSDKRE